MPNQFEPPEGDLLAEEPGARVRLLTDADLAAAVEIDRRAQGRSREAYWREKFAACLREPGLNTSLVAELEGRPVGFLMGQLFFGEFGIPTRRAVLDTLVVHPGFTRQGVARALVTQYRKNMEALRVEAIDTLVGWDRPDLLGLFRALGFCSSRNVDLVWEIERYPFRGRDSAARVRPATPEDLPLVTAIDRETTLAPRAGYFAAKMQAAKMQAAGQQPARTLFRVAELEGEVAGFLVALFYRGEFGIDETRGVVDSFGVWHRFRHRGVASALMEHLLETLRERGVRQMETLCRWNEWDLLQFFEYVGFRPSARLNLEWRFAEE